MGRIAVLLCVLLVSCGNRIDSTVLTCPPVDGVEQVLDAPGVFIGDQHGTNQSPAFLGALACHALQTQRPVVVAMEYHAPDQPVLDRFLQIEDAGEAMALLTSTQHWTGNEDGRASTAMANALRTLHGYARSGGKLQLVAYDFWGADPQQRDATSAQFLQQRRAQADADAYWILFGGNVHARKIKGLEMVPGYEDHEPLGYLLRDWGLIHLDAKYLGGEGWGCNGPSRADCGVTDLGPACPTGCALQPVIRLNANHPAYDGVYDVGMLSVSRPLHWR